MKTPIQTTLPTLTDWSEPQTVASHALDSTIKQANAAGYDAVALTVLSPLAYRVRFQRMPAPSDPPCGCDLCTALGAPSDLIEATLRHSAAQDAPQAMPDTRASNAKGSVPYGRLLVTDLPKTSSLQNKLTVSFQSNEN